MNNELSYPISTKVGRICSESLVIDYFLRGFTFNIASLSIGGIKKSTARNIWKSFSKLNDNTGRAFGDRSTMVAFLKTSTYLTNTKRVILVNEFLHYYTLMGGEKTKREIDIKAVIYAHNVMIKIYEGDNDIFTINGAWLIARDYRSRTINLPTCVKCKINFPVVEDQRRVLTTCPYCGGDNIEYNHRIHHKATISKEKRVAA